MRNTTEFHPRRSIWGYVEYARHAPGGNHMITTRGSKPGPYIPVLFVPFPCSQMSCSGDIYERISHVVLGDCVVYNVDTPFC